MARKSRKSVSKSVEAFIHEEATRKNIPTAEYQSVMRKEEQSPVRVTYERRNRDLDPQLVWRGKDERDWSDLVVHAPPLYIQEKVHPKALIDDLVSRSRADEQANEKQTDLFADFNGLPDDDARTEFYRHDANWSNRMILGDSLQVMATLAEREGLRGKVQCIYLDPPYGIKFNSNFQWSTTSRDVKDGKTEHVTREPEQVKAFRDTWRDGIHSYLTYLRDRLTVARDLLADTGSIFDKPYEDRRIARVAGPFTVESLSPHRVLGVDENDELIEGVAESRASYGSVTDFASVILENLGTAGVQQAHKEDRITFTSLTPWPGHLICAQGRYIEGGSDQEDQEDASGQEKRAAVFIGPEFGTVSRPDLVAAAREAGDADFDVLIACAFNYDAHSSEFDKLGRIPVLKARMNADLHMADELKNTGKGNLFVIFGEPDIDILEAGDGQIQVKVNGVDVFHPQTGEVRSDGPDGIACWFIDTDYNEESFFVRHAYFLGANDPYKALKTTLKAEINQDAWATLHSDTSRPFAKPKSGRIAVKVINHLGDEVMKVFRA